MKRAVLVLALGLSACELAGERLEKGDASGGIDGNGGGDAAAFGDSYGSGDGVAAGDPYDRIDGGPGDAAGGGAHVGAVDDAEPGDSGGSPCRRTPPPDDFVRKVVVSHPYDASASPSTRWAVWELDLAGNLTHDGTTFQMGRATSGTVAFTADGEIGLVAQEDGSLGVFRLGATVKVLETGYAGIDHPFYAGDVIVTPDGSHALVVDPNWRNNGGGIYGLRVECDGSLTEEGKLAESKLAQTLRFVPGRDDRLVVPARDVSTSVLDHDLHLLGWDGALAMLGSGAGFHSAVGFPSDESTLAGFAVVPDGHYALLGDNNEWHAVSHRVAVVEIVGDTLVTIDVLASINDPVAMVASPYDDAVVVLDGYGNGFNLLAYDVTDAVEPFINLGEPTYSGAPPQLPSSAVVIERGGLTGLVLIAENTGVRRVQLAVGPYVTDLGLTSYGAPIARIVGAFGVQP